METETLEGFKLLTFSSPLVRNAINMKMIEGGRGIELF